MVDKLYKILKDGKNIESEVPGIYGGYKVDKIFGTLSCKSGMRMKKENRVFFHTLEDAVKQGYRPCKNCKPIDEKDFQTINHLVPEKTLQDFYNRPNKKTKIKTFESFVSDLDPYGEEKWENEWLFDVTSGSYAEIPSELDKDVLEKVLKYTVRSLVDEDTPNGKFKKEQYDKAMIEYAQYPTATWQYKKVREIAEKTVENTHITIEDNMLRLTCNFKIELESFDEGDVKEWVASDGFCEFVNAYNFNEIEYIVKNKKNSEYNDLIRDVMTQIRKNCRVRIID